MRDHSERLGWIGTAAFWLGVVFVLPNCSFNPETSDPPAPNLPKGLKPHDSVIFCDIEKVLGRHCATSQDKAIGIRLSAAAVALAEGQTSTIGLDDSPEALARCGGEPEAVLFEGPFPQGMPVCLNCTNFPTATVDQACELACYDLFGPVDSFGNKIPENPPDPLVVDFCSGKFVGGVLVSPARARASVNHASVTCFGGACSSDGVFDPLFPDPRRASVSVQWTDFFGVTVSGVDLLRTAPFTGSFDAGAASAQWITRGDGYLDFGITRNMQVGLAALPAGCPYPCPDANPGLTDIDFAIDGGADGLLYVNRNGVKVIGPGINGSFGSYNPTDRFRIAVRSRGNGTAQVSFLRILASCVPGQPCATALIHTDSGAPAYPFRVDTSLQEQGTAVFDARLVYIH